MVDAILRKILYVIFPGPTVPREICRFFERGHCTYGDRCRFIHPGINDKGWTALRKLVTFYGCNCFPFLFCYVVPGFRDFSVFEEIRQFDRFAKRFYSFYFLISNHILKL